MSGLIWAGIGKGIADAGTTFGNAMFKAIDADIAEQRLLDREERRAKLKEDERKAERDAQERVDIASRTSKRADEIATARFEAPLAKDAATLAKSSAQAGEDGDIALSEDQLKELMRNDPKLRESYKKSGIIGGAIESAVDPRLQRANDEEQAVRELGGKASVVEAYAKAKKDVLAQIAQENKDAREAKRGEQQDRRLDLMEERITSQGKTDQQKADAATTRANRPPSSGSGGGAGGGSVDLRGLQAEATAAARAEENARKIVATKEKAVKESYGEAKASAQADLAAANKRLAEAQDAASAARKRISDWNSSRSGGAPAPKTGDNADTRPPLSAFKR